MPIDQEEAPTLQQSVCVGRLLKRPTCPAPCQQRERHIVEWQVCTCAIAAGPHHSLWQRPPHHSLWQRASKGSVPYAGGSHARHYALCRRRPSQPSSQPYVSSTPHALGSLRAALQHTSPSRAGRRRALNLHLHLTPNVPKPQHHHHFSPPHNPSNIHPIPIPVATLKIATPPARRRSADGSVPIPN